MHALKTAIGLAWILFWVGWLASAVSSKQQAPSGRRVPLAGVTVIALVIVLRVGQGSGLEVHSLALVVAGAAVFAAGIALAVWARICLGRNWGMPMTRKLEPELVTTGPYRLVRHPIYTGLLLALLGTTLANNLFGLIVVALAGAYFTYAATVEERSLADAFPAAYPAYREHTWKLIPFLI
jgi:protein-S-isoprenylcysteine O-methyltransferase Ste14